MNVLGKELWMWLADGLGYGAVNTGELLQAFPEGPQAVADNLGDPRLDDLLTQKQAERLASSRPEDFSLNIAMAKSDGIETLAYDDPDYPDMLRHINNPPLVLFAKGDTTLLNGQLSIGMVGTRRPSAYGMEATALIGKGIALGGAIIVSGLAAGLDSEAHKAALSVNGPTIACMAFGHNHCYPSANRKLMEVIGRHGLLLSEYPPDTKPEKPYFLHRNRIIAGLSHGLLVVEARRYSGTMSTVNFATDYGRDIFAVPGSMFSDLSVGTNDMIREGAYLASSAKDVLTVYGIEDIELEDPVAVAQKAERQSASGSPSAQAEPPNIWANGYVKTENTVLADTKDQTLGEALQQKIAADGGNGSVSGKQAVEAFRKVQGEVQPASSKGGDAKVDEMLERMAESVSDSVEISGKASSGKEKPSGSKPIAMVGDKPVHLFEWDRVERLDKKEILKMTGAPARPAQQQYNPAIREINKTLRHTVYNKTVTTETTSETSESQTKAPTVGALQYNAVTAENTGYASEVKATGSAKPNASKTVAEAVGNVQAAIEAEYNQNADHKPDKTGKGRPAEEPTVRKPVLDITISDPVPAKQEKPVAEPRETIPQIYKNPPEVPEPAPSPEHPRQPAAEPKAEKPVVAKPLSGKLRTLQAQPEPEEPAQVQEDDQQGPNELYLLSSLSGSARKALRQLGPVPVTLSQICETSGLSTGEAMAALTELELSGLSRQLAGRQFVIVQ